MSHSVYFADGSFDFSLGVDSSKVPTVQSALVPLGLPRSALAWLTNGTVRSGAILQRTGWVPNGQAYNNTGFYQGGYMYEPIDGNSPYLILSISGNIIAYSIETGQSTNLSVTFGITNPPLIDYAYFVQAEEFLVIQAGDSVTLPLFWDGSTLRRSVGIISPNNTPAGGATPFNEIPAATAMDYYQGHIWYAQGRIYCAGDTVKNSASGTAVYRFRDSVLKVTESPLAFGGDGFSVPDNAGNIRAIKHSQNINTQLGQGQLFIATRKAIYTLQVPKNRADWIAVTANQQPEQDVVQLNNGWVNDRSVVPVNGDLYGQALDPSVRSLKMAVRNFSEWYNLPVSSNVDRALAFNNRELMRFSSGINFNNRLLQAILPKQLPQGVVHQGVLPLDFSIISDFASVIANAVPPAWEGMYGGQNILQLFSGDFGGLERAFSVIVSEVDGSIQVWELTTDKRFDNVDSRVVWDFETPAWTWGKEFELKKLVGGEIWVSKVFGRVTFDFYYRADADPCWRFWHHHEVCVARDCAENALNPVCSPYPYPGENPYREGYKWPITLPEPKAACDSMGVRPTTIGYQFQMRVVIKGWCQIHGLFLYAEMKERALYDGVCQSSPLFNQTSQTVMPVVPVNGGGFIIPGHDISPPPTSTGTTVPIPGNTSPAITGQPQNTSVNIGERASFSVTVTSDTPVSYQWYFGNDQNNPVPGGTNSVLVISNAQNANAGQYWVSVSNASGITHSQTATLTVNPAPVTPVGPNPNGPGILNSDGTITVTLTNVTVSSSVPVVGFSFVEHQNVSGPGINIQNMRNFSGPCPPLHGVVTAVCDVVVGTSGTGITVIVDAPPPNPPTGIGFTVT